MEETGKRKNRFLVFVDNVFMLLILSVLSYFLLSTGYGQLATGYLLSFAGVRIDSEKTIDKAKHDFHVAIIRFTAENLSEGNTGEIQKAYNIIGQDKKSITAFVLQYPYLAKSFSEIDYLINAGYISGFQELVDEYMYNLLVSSKDILSDYIGETIGTGIKSLTDDLMLLITDIRNKIK